MRKTAQNATKKFMMMMLPSSHMYRIEVMSFRLVFPPGKLHLATTTSITLFFSSPSFGAKGCVSLSLLLLLSQTWQKMACAE